jgi:patatin-like phospholipase/acyl hydrolase
MPKVRGVLTEGPKNLSPEDRIDLDPLDQSKICLLSLDGGGIQGLSMLLILKELMTRLNQSLEAANLEAIKLCYVFDLIAGTSVGG